MSPLVTPSKASGICRITVAYAALHRTVLYDGRDTGLYVVAADDGTRFFARSQLPLYDAHAKQVRMREVLPGSHLNVKFRVRDGYKIIEAVQIISEPEPDCPFQPVFEPDDTTVG